MSALIYGFSLSGAFRIGLGTAIGITALAPILQARTWQIHANGSGDAPTIQAGIDSAATGDSVLVGPGTFSETLTFRGRDIVLQGSGPEVTILDASGLQESGMKFTLGETNSCIVEDLTVTGGVGSLNAANQRLGGAVLCIESSPLIRGVHFNKNQAHYGGAIYVGVVGAIPNPDRLPRITLTGSIFTNNLARGGGGAMFINNGAEVTIQSNNFHYNTSAYDGGGIYAYLSMGSFVLSGNSFIQNEAGDKGGGLHLGANLVFSGVSCTVEGNLFARNSALGGDVGDSGAGGGICLTGEGIIGRVISNTIVFNTGIGESLCGGGGVKLIFTPLELGFRDNIIAFNTHCGVACRNIGGIIGAGSFNRNILWGNGGANLGEQFGECPQEWVTGSIYDDPQFCNPAIDDYTVAASSPAVSNGAPIGAFPDPGCPPVAAMQTTWGRIKAAYQGRP